MPSAVPGGTISHIKQLMLVSFVSLPPTQHGIEVAVKLSQPKIPGGRRACGCGAHIEHAMDCGGMVAHPKSRFEVAERVVSHSGFCGMRSARLFLRIQLRA
jgi:hypothetical protein